MGLLVPAFDLSWKQGTLFWYKHENVGVSVKWYLAIGLKEELHHFFVCLFVFYPISVHLIFLNGITSQLFHLQISLKDSFVRSQDILLWVTEGIVKAILYHPTTGKKATEFVIKKVEDQSSIPVILRSMVPSGGEIYSWRTEGKGWGKTLCASNP